MLWLPALFLGPPGPAVQMDCWLGKVQWAAGNSLGREGPRSRNQARWTPHLSGIRGHGASREPTAGTGAGYREMQMARTELTAKMVQMARTERTERMVSLR